MKERLNITRQGHPRRKLSDHDVRAIRCVEVDRSRNPHKELSVAGLARTYGVTRATIRKAMAGETYKETT